MVKTALVFVLFILLALSCSKKEPASPQAASAAENEVSQEAYPTAAEKATESKAPPEAAKRPYQTQSRSGGYTGVMITARRRARETAALLGIRQAIQAGAAGGGLSWLQVDNENLSAHIVGLPARDEIDADVDEQVVTEFYAR